MKNISESKQKSHNCIAMMKETGIQPTAHRIAIYKFIIANASHPTADDIKDFMDDNFPKISLATVYNTLNVLVDSGLLRSYRFSHLDKVIYDANLSHHHHFLDEKTGRIIDIPASMIAIDSKLDKSFEINNIDILMTGKLV